MADEKRPEFSWQDALADVNLDPEPPVQHRKLPADEISAIEEEDLLRALIFKQANALADKMEKQAAGLIPREKIHTLGWTLAIETPEGVVGLRNPWSGVNLMLKFPKDAPGSVYLTDELIKKVLKVEDVPEMANFPFDIRKRYGAFYGQREAEGGRVWIKDSKNLKNILEMSTNRGLEVIRDGKLKQLPLSSADRVLSTYNLDLFDEENPDFPTSDPQAIQKFKDGFINLAARTSFFLGGAKSITTNFNVLFTPEELIREGYSFKEEQGDPQKEERTVIGEKGDATIILVNNSRQITWGTYVRFPTTQVNSPSQLEDFIQDIILRF